MITPHHIGGMRGNPVTLDDTVTCSPLTDLTVLHKDHNVDKRDNASTSQKTAEHHRGAATQQSIQLINSLTNL
jgi:hypothetical protein